MHHHTILRELRAPKFESSGSRHWSVLCAILQALFSLPWGVLINSGLSYGVACFTLSARVWCSLQLHQESQHKSGNCMGVGEGARGQERPPVLRAWPDWELEKVLGMSGDDRHCCKKLSPPSLQARKEAPCGEEESIPSFAGGVGEQEA